MLDHPKGSGDRLWGVRPVGKGEPPQYSQYQLHAGYAALLPDANQRPRHPTLPAMSTITARTNCKNLCASGPTRAKSPSHSATSKHNRRPDSDKSALEEGLPRFPDASGDAIEIRAEFLEPLYDMVGAGYGLE